LTGELIKGTIDAKDHKKIKYFYKIEREKLIKNWEELKTDLIIP